MVGVLIWWWIASGYENTDDAFIDARTVRVLQQSQLNLSYTRISAPVDGHIARRTVATFINVLTATTTELNARDEVAQSTQALTQDLVSLYKALGGGWSDQSGAAP